VPGDDPALIASGPTVPDTTTQADARAVLARYGIAPSPRVAAVLDDPAHALPAPDHPAFAEAQVRVVARPMAALEAAAGVLAAAGYAPVILGDAIEGEARKVGAEHAALALARRTRGERVALISGGECTVKLRPEAGRGGPNAEYLMALALGLDGAAGISALAVDTDGIDGSADNAGAMIDPTTLARAAAAGIDWRAALDANRSYDSFAALGDLVMTGPTFTNVNDLRIILIEQ
jgi:hydroxypyruvate reductase